MTNNNTLTRTLSLAAAVVCAAGVAHAATIADFDPTTYSTGALNGQDGWTASGAGSQTVSADGTAPSSPNVLSIINPESGSTVINRVVSEPSAGGSGIVRFLAKHDAGNTFSATSGLALQFHATLEPGEGAGADRFFSVGFVRDDDRFIWNVFGAGGSDPGGQSANATVALDTWYQFTVGYEYDGSNNKTVDLDIRLPGSSTAIVSENLFIANNNGGRPSMEFLSFDFAIAGNTSTFYVDSIQFIVPEPGTLALLGIGGLVLGGSRRMRPVRTTRR